MDGHQFRGARIHRDMMLVSSVCRRALGCEWGEYGRERSLSPAVQPPILLLAHTANSHKPSRRVLAV